MELAGDIAQVVSAAVIIIALIYAFFHYRETKRTREATYLVPKLEEWQSPDMQDAVTDAKMKKEEDRLHYYDAREDRRVLRKVCSVPVFFNSLAKLVDLKAITEKTATDQFGADAIWLWGLYSEFIIEMREEYLGIYGGFERFAAKARERPDTVD